MKNNSPITILIVGLGSIGQRHARLLSERADVKLLLCDLSKKNQQDLIASVKNKHAVFFDDYDKALLENPDIVFVCTHNDLHVPMGIKAVEIGADIFIEKPISDSLESANSLLECTKKAGCLCHVGYMLRFDDGLLNTTAPHSL